MTQHDDTRFPVLIGDLGGTNARFAIVPDAGSKPIELPIVPTADFATIEDAIAAVVIGDGRQTPRSAVLAVAGPVRSERIAFTNAKWVIEPRKLLKRFQFEEIILLNDFEAQSLALPRYVDGNLHRIGAPKIDNQSPETRLAIGPGTGLGAAALLRIDGSWAPVATEGGHIDFGPMTTRDQAIWPHLRPLHGKRISAEAILSGPGLLSLYGAVAAADEKPATIETSAAITEAALAGSDPIAVEAVTLFVSYLGRFAGDLALAFLARGGVYLTGGIVPHLLPIIEKGGFRRAFEWKEPHEALLKAIPSVVITHDTPAFVGLAGYVSDRAAFKLALEGRRWAAGE